MLLEILAGVVLFFGVAAFPAAGVLLYRALHERYVRVPGEVLAVEMEKYQQHAKGGLIFTYHRGKYRVRYQTGEKVREVDARPEFGITSAAKAKKRIEAHAVGSVHPVRYRRSRPESLVLESPRRAVGIALSLVAAGISLIGVSAVTYFASQAADW